jgi:hypothetical protein
LASIVQRQLARTAATATMSNGTQR